MIQQICLIIPPSLFLARRAGLHVTGILKVAAVLEQEDVTVELLDLSGVTNYEEALAAHITHSQAECFGITATTPQMPAATKIHATIRRLRPAARIILGGPHVTLVYAAAKHERQTKCHGSRLESESSNSLPCSTSSSQATEK